MEQMKAEQAEAARKAADEKAAKVAADKATAEKAAADRKAAAEKAAAEKAAAAKTAKEAKETMSGKSAASTALGQPSTLKGLSPLPAPPSTISSSKEQQLQALLEQYKADQITPQEYHERRAKILSEP